MALVTMQDVLKVAEEKKIAIAAFTVDTLEVAEEIASVAEEKQLPAIMMVGQNTFKYNKLEKLQASAARLQTVQMHNWFYIWIMAHPMNR